MHERGCRNQRVPLRPRIGNMKPCASLLRDGRIDRQHTTGERRENLSIQPGTQHGVLYEVAPLDQKDALLQF